jgi:threonine dehydrogenase-like Zn-dependent dehydrogenase
MKGAVLYTPGDVRLVARETPRILEPTDAVIRVAATCVCGSDLWDYRGINPVTQPKAMGHEYCGIVEGVGGEVRSIKPGQFVIGSFLPPTTPVRIARLVTKPRACIASSSVARRRPICGCHWRTAPWWPPRRFLRTT